MCIILIKVISIKCSGKGVGLFPILSPMVTKNRFLTLNIRSYARQHAIARICCRNSARFLSITRVDHSKTVEVRIMQFSPYTYHRPVILVFAG